VLHGEGLKWLTEAVVCLLPALFLQAMDYSTTSLYHSAATLKTSVEKIANNTQLWRVKSFCIRLKTVKALLVARKH